MEHDAIRMSGDVVIVDVLVVPNASSTKVVGPHGDRIRLRVTAAPQGGKANRAVEKLLADVTGAEHSEVVSGVSSRSKTLHLWGVSVHVVCESLLES